MKTVFMDFHDKKKEGKKVHEIARIYSDFFTHSNFEPLLLYFEKSNSELIK